MKNKAGFTLIELLVSLGFFALLGAMRVDFIRNSANIWHKTTKAYMPCATQGRLQ